MRTVLVTGPGGAGRTTLAAATARAAARTGTRVLLLTADPGDRLGTALGTPLGPAPVEAAPGLHALRLDAADRLRADLLALQERAATALDALGATPLTADELTPLPGAEELALLRALRELAALPDGDPARPGLVVVDLPAAPARWPCSPSPASSAATSPGCCPPNARPPAPCAPSSAASPDSRSPARACTRPPPAGTPSWPPPRPP